MPIVARKPSEKKYIKALIHSPHGHGKTHFLGTAQEDERTAPMAFLNFEGGDQTLAGLDVDVYDMRDMQDYKEARRMLVAPSNPYKSVGIDSVTETQVAGFLAILEKDKNRGDADLMAQQDWGISLVQMRRFIRDFKFLPMHTFFTALSKDDVVARVGQVKTPAVQGAFQYELPGIVDVVAYMALDEDETGVHRVMLLHSYPKFSVKCRTPWGVTVPSEIGPDPSVTDLLDVLGYRTTRTAQQAAPRPAQSPTKTGPSPVQRRP